MSYLSDAKARIVAMQEECIPNSKAVAYYFYHQAKFPYWTNRIAAYAPQGDSEQLEYRPYALVMRYVIGHVTEGLPGGLDTRLDEDIPTIETFFAQRVMLNSKKYPAPLDNLDPTGMYLTLSQGLAVLESTGIGVQQIGTEFTARLSFVVDIDQLY